jgi:hypothetical protein
VGYLKKHVTIKHGEWFLKHIFYVLITRKYFSGSPQVKMPTLTSQAKPSQLAIKWNGKARLWEKLHCGHDGCMFATNFGGGVLKKHYTDRHGGVAPPSSATAVTRSSVKNETSFNYDTSMSKEGKIKRRTTRNCASSLREMQLDFEQMLNDEKLHLKVRIQLCFLVLMFHQNLFFRNTCKCSTFTKVT